MPNKSYRKGVRIERKIIEKLEDVGYISFRSAGSGGPFDVIALGHGDVRFIQAKCVNKDDNPFDSRFDVELEVLEEIAGECGAPNLSFELWVNKDYSGFVRKERF